MFVLILILNAFTNTVTLSKGVQIVFRSKYPDSKILIPYLLLNFFSLSTLLLIRSTLYQFHSELCIVLKFVYFFCLPMELATSRIFGTFSSPLTPHSYFLPLTPRSSPLIPSK